MRKLAQALLLASLITAPSLGVSPPAWAEEKPDPAKLKQEMDALKARLSELEKKLEKPEKSEKPATAPTAAVVELQPPSWPVSGIYTAPDTKDLGQVTGISWLNGTKARGWIDTYYVYNFNTPDRTTVNTNQLASVIKGRNVSIEGRTFDIHHNSFGLSLAELEIEKVPEPGRVGFKFDMAFGETQDIIVDSIRGGLGPTAFDSVTDFDKTFQHASVSYLAPIGKGLRIDAGKFVTHIGGETIETVKNWNYSHSFFYTYAIPFQDTGIRLNYPWSDTFYTELYILNGWNVTVDNNKGKTVGPSIGWTPAPWISLYANYLVGPERNDNTRDDRHLVDMQLFLSPFDRWNFLINFDYGVDKNAVAGPPVADAQWYGVTGYARYKLSERFEPSLRLEYYNDPDGFTTGVAQNLRSVTLTLNTKVGLGKGSGSIILLRPEIRYDRSNAPFYTKDGNFRSTKNQVTVGLGASWMF